jgi:hypothetical protein
VALLLLLSLSLLACMHDVVLLLHSLMLSLSDGFNIPVMLSLIQAA